MKERGYAFPVLVGTRYLNKLLPEIMQGQIWIVDATGTLRLQRTENMFNGREQALVDEAMYKMSQLSRAVR